MAHASDRRTTLARLAVGGADAPRGAARLADLLAESLDAAVAAFETSEGWAVELHFVGEPDQAAVRTLLARIAGAAAAHALAFEPVPAKDWVAASLGGLAPVAAGRFVVHGAHDRARVAANKLGIEIEAGLAFGTGHHGSTRGCLLALDAIAKQWRPRRILDLGTGSGVLAIAAAKALRARVVASDIDPQALRVARANARLNSVAPAIEFVHAAGLSAHIGAAAPFDLVLANILLNPLTRMARALIRLLAPDARVVLSGLLRTQEQAALAAYRGLVLERRTALDEWVTLVLRV